MRREEFEAVCREHNLSYARPPDPPRDEAPAGPAAGASEANTKDDTRDHTAAPVAETHGQLAMQAPDEIRSLPGWVVWRHEGGAEGQKPRKVPYYAAGGRRHGVQGRPEDRAQLVTFDAACAAAARRGMDGVGLCLLTEFGITVLDFDKAVTGQGLHPELAGMLSDTYVEFSPSGTGVHAIYRGNLGDRKSHADEDRFGVEAFNSKGFVTFTGNALPHVADLELAGPVVAPVNDRVRALCAARFGRQSGIDDDGAPMTCSPPLGLTESQILDALAVLDPAMGHDDWLSIGMAIHHETDGERFDLWDDWSSLAEAEYPGREELSKRWESFGKAGGVKVTARSLVKMANEHGAGISVAAVATVDDFDDVSASVPPATAHAWTRFLELRAVPQAPRFIVPWFIQEGVVVIAGAPGVGKTTTLLPLALTAAGLHRDGDPLAPEHWRHICYLTEAPEQVEQMLAAAARCPELGVSFERIAERVHVAPLHRMAPAEAVKAGGFFAANFTRRVGETVIPPLVVIDTQAAALALENENANSEVSAAVAAFKQRFAGLPVWFVSHTAKTQWENNDAKALTARGGGAWGGDAHQLLFVVEDCGRSYLRRSKTRFEARWPELEITTDVLSVPMLHADGTAAEHPVRWASLAPVGAAQGAADRKDDAMRIALGLVSVEQEAGNPVSTAEGGDGHAGRRLRAMDKTLARMKAGAVRELLVEAEGRGLLTQVPRPTAGGRMGAAWELTDAGRTWLETL